ncbi:MAG: transposase [Thiothrix sp.]|nr:transposase [Thiothrix sp.]HPQ95264.1 transposase [Thiolinea sp.]
MEVKNTTRGGDVAIDRVNGYLAFPGIITLDNASIHRSQAVLDRIEHWLVRGIGLHFIPADSPELNLIETLWRKVKYEWLPMKAYQSFSTLKETVLDVLDSVDRKFQITFA